MMNINVCKLLTDAFGLKAGRLVVVSEYFGEHNDPQPLLPISNNFVSNHLVYEGATFIGAEINRVAEFTGAYSDLAVDEMSNYKAHLNLKFSLSEGSAKQIQTVFEDAREAKFDVTINYPTPRRSNS